jgi:hypothetical protein
MISRNMDVTDLVYTLPFFINFKEITEALCYKSEGRGFESR